LQLRWRSVVRMTKMETVHEWLKRALVNTRFHIRRRHEIPRYIGITVFLDTIFDSMQLYCNIFLYDALSQQTLQR